MTYGVDIYGVNSYNSNINIISGIKKIYLGCEPNDGFEGNGVFDELIVYADFKTDAQIATIYSSESPIAWSDTTIFNAKLDTNLQGGNLFADGIDVARWSVYKKRSTDTDYVLMKTILNDDSGANTILKDFEVTNHIDYEYLLEGEAIDGTVTSKFETSGNKINFDGIYIIDNIKGIQFHFRYNLPEFTFNSKSDRSLTETFSRFPIIRRNIVNYKMGSLQCDVVQNSANNADVFDQINVLKSFEGSANLALKIDNGDIFKVDIFNIVYTRHPETNEISTIKCDYVQTGEVIQYD